MNPKTKLALMKAVNDLRQVVAQALDESAASAEYRAPLGATGDPPRPDHAWERLLEIEDGKRFDSAIITWEQAAAIIGDYRRLRGVVKDVVKNFPDNLPLRQIVGTAIEFTPEV